MVLVAAGALSGALIDEYGGPVGALVWAFRTLVVFAAAAVIVGLLILALRVRRLIRSRVLGWVAAIAAFAAAAWFVAIPVGFAVYLSHLPARRAVEDADLGAAKREVTIPVSDGLRLRGWYVPSRNRAAVIALHGTGSNRNGVERHSRLLARHGYGVLALDLRGHGDSDGRSTSAAWLMDDDLAASVRWLAGRKGVDRQRIGLLGVSMGAEVAVRTAADEAAVAAVVAEGLNGGLSDARAAGQSALAIAQLAVLSAASSLFTGEGTGSDADLVARIAPRPLLLLSAGTGPEADTNRLFRRRAGANAELWNLPNAPHGAALRTAPREYERRVVGFFDRTLAG